MVGVGVVFEETTAVVAAEAGRNGAGDCFGWGEFVDIDTTTFRGSRWGEGMQETEVHQRRWKRVDANEMKGSYRSEWGVVLHLDKNV